MPIQIKPTPTKRWYQDPWHILAAVLGAATLIPIGSLFPWNWLQSESAPSWVQAIGSVAAIAVAIWYPEHRLRHERAEDRLANLAELRDLSKEITEHLGEFMSFYAMNPSFVPKIDDGTLDNWRDRCRAVSSKNLARDERQMADLLRSELRTIRSRMRNNNVYGITREQVISIKGKLEMEVHIPALYRTQ